MRPIEGPALVFGHEVNTDELHPSIFYSLDDTKVRAGFLRHVEGHERTGEGDLSGRVVVAGRTFGIGSSRETGARVFQLAGIRAVVAVSFARIFQRNLMNLGIPAFSCGGLEGRMPDAGTVVRIEGGELCFDGERLGLEPLDPYWQAVLEAGGLIPFLGLGRA